MINVCLSCDDNYSKHAGVVIASILANAKSGDNLNFYILDGGITENNKQKIRTLTSIKGCKINFIQVYERMFEEYKKVKTHKYVTLATYFRLKLPTILPAVSRVIYLDCDMIVEESLEKLFNKYLGNCAIAGVHDIKNRRVQENPTYVNAGMLLMDLDNMRSQNLEEKFLKWTNEHIDTIKTGDQEIINEVCRGNILLIEDEWNVQSSNFTNRSSYTNSPKIIHYVSERKPWHYGSFSYHRDLYFKYLQLTPWKLSDEDLKHWTKDNQIVSVLNYLKYRPFFFLRPKFYRAFYETYLKNNYKKKDIKILVAYHKKDKLYTNDMLIPIHCGRNVAFKKLRNGKISTEEFLWLKKNLIGDDTFDNISHLNMTLNEMTAIYWAWKNYDKIGNPDYIGLNHYRRFFEINYASLDRILAKYDFVKQRHSVSRFSFYELWGKEEDRSIEFMDNAIKICKLVNPEEGGKIEEFLKGNVHRGFCNMFIMSKEDFFNYCNMIFPIILELPRNIYYGRQAGYFAELLTSYYLYKLAKTKKAYNTSIVSYFENNNVNYIKDNIFSIKTEKLSNNAHMIIKCFGLKMKLKY